MERSESIFSQVLQASLAATILGIIVLLMERVLRKRLSPAWLFTLYLPVVVRLLLPTFPESPTSIFNLGRIPWARVTDSKTEALTSDRAAFLPAQEISMQAPLPLQTPASSTMSTPALESGVTVLQILSFAWLFVAAALLLRLVAGVWRLHAMLSKSCSTAPELLTLLAELRGKLRTIWSPKLIETPLVQSPCLLGFFQPMILLPVGLARRLTAPELSHVILHELAHLKRGDQFVNALLAVAHSIHWFNPVVWLLLRRMRLQRELACDRLVLETQRADPAEARAYGETLLKLVQEYSPRSSTPSLVGMLEGEQSVKSRLRQLATFNHASRRGPTAGVVILLTLVAIGLSNAQTEKTRTGSGEVQQTGKKPIRTGATNADRAGIEALSREYERQKEEVAKAQVRVDRLRQEYGITSLEESGSNTGKEDQISLQQRLKAVSDQHSYDNAMLSHLKTLNRRDLRKSLPTALRPPDELLNRYLADLGAAEQKLIVLSERFGEEHFEVRSARNLIQKIEEQIEHRMDGILAGLEARKAVAENLSSNLQAMLKDSRVQYGKRQQEFSPFFEAKRSLENAQRTLDTIHMRLLAEKVDEQLSRVEKHNQDGSPGTR